MQMWPKIQEQCPDIKFEIVPFENTPENAKEILANLGKNIDIIGGIFDDTMLKLRKCEGLQLSCEPFCCAVSIHHKLAQKDKLQISDLYGENLMLMHRAGAIMLTNCVTIFGKIIRRFILLISIFTV